MLTIDPRIRALLISNSTNHGEGYLDHVANAIFAFLGAIKKVVFVPYALKDWGAYTEKARARFAEMGIELISVEDVVQEEKSAAKLWAILPETAVFVGGGNTFLLQRELERSGNLWAIQHKVREQGMPYIGASAGVNVACPTIMTTNDMPIAQPNTFSAINLVPFQINPHYVDSDPNSTHMGETREQRIKEFHEQNETPVVGLREGSWVQVEGGRAKLHGPKNARIFMPGMTLEISEGSIIDGAINSMT